MTISEHGESRKTWLFAGLAVLFWSTVASAFKLALRHMTPQELLFWSNLVSAVFFVTWLAVRGRIREMLPSSIGQATLVVILGIVSPFLYYTILFRAYDLLPAQVAQPLNYTWAIVLSVLAVPLLGRKLSLYDAIGGLLAYSGVWLICTKGDISLASDISSEGVILALASTLLWATYWILLTRDKKEPDAMLAMTFTASLPFTFALALFFGLSFPTRSAMIGAAYVGLFEMGITFILWGLALKTAKRPARVATLIFVSPFLSLVFIHYLVGETIAVSSVAGLFVIVAGLLLQRRSNRKDTGKTA